MKLLRIFCSYISTGLWCGYFPMPGTTASIITAIVAYFCGYHELSLYVKIWLLVFCIVSTYVIIAYALPLHQGSDPQEIVIDEVAGCLIALFFAHTIQDYIGCVILFRFFDITKTGGIWRAEKLPGAWGILIDDLIAGAYALIGYWCMHMIIINVFIV